jgi:hypothetical protein
MPSTPRKGCVYNLLSEATCARGSFRCDRKHRVETTPREQLVAAQRGQREAFKAGFLAVCTKKGDAASLDLLTRVWSFDGVAAADLEPEAYAAWRRGALRSSPTMPPEWPPKPSQADIDRLEKAAWDSGTEAVLVWYRDEIERLKAERS